MATEHTSIRGQTLSFKFSDGPMAGKAIEHTFAHDGTVTWKTVGGEDKPSKPMKYELERVSFDVFAMSYLGDSGYTLTVVLDFNSGVLVAFASNEKSLSVQHGLFEVARRAA